MTIKEQCNLEDLYNLYYDDFIAHYKEEPTENGFDFLEFDTWYERFTILQAKKVALEEFVERLGYRFYKYDNGFRLEKGD